MYNARKDLSGVTSGHTPYARTFAAKGETLKIAWQDACVFYNKLPVCPFLVAANAATDPKAVSDVLGKDGVGLVLKNGGLLTCSATVDGAVGNYLRLDGLCGNQMLAEAAAKARGGEIIPIGEEEIIVSGRDDNVGCTNGQFTQNNTGGEYANWFMSTPYFARQVAKHGSPLVI